MNQNFTTILCIYVLIHHIDLPNVAKFHDKTSTHYSRTMFCVVSLKRWYPGWPGLNLYSLLQKILTHFTQKRKGKWFLLVYLEKTTPISGILDIYDSFPKILLFLMVYGCIMSDDQKGGIQGDQGSTYTDCCKKY